MPHIKCRAMTEKLGSAISSSQSIGNSNFLRFSEGSAARMQAGIYFEGRLDSALEI